MPRGRNRDSTTDSSGGDSDDGSGGGDTDNGSVIIKQYRDSSGDSDVEDNEGIRAEWMTRRLLLNSQLFLLQDSGERGAG